jgi:hypothetical protein
MIFLIIGLLLIVIGVVYTTLVKLRGQCLIFAGNLILLIGSIINFNIFYFIQSLFFTLLAIWSVWYWVVKKKVEW